MVKIATERFSGKVAFITGAASGIGLGMAKAFHAAGLRVVLADQAVESARHEASALGMIGHDAIALISTSRMPTHGRARSTRPRRHLGRSTFSAQMPGEAGAAGLEAYIWYGLMGPANLPKEVVFKTQAAAAALVADPEIVQKIFNVSRLEAVSSTPAEFRDFVAAEIRRNIELAKSIGFQPQ